jgi:hypothetical protein
MFVLCRKKCPIDLMSVSKVCNLFSPLSSPTVLYYIDFLMTYDMNDLQIRSALQSPVAIFSWKHDFFPDPCPILARYLTGSANYSKGICNNFSPATFREQLGRNSVCISEFLRILPCILRHAEVKKNSFVGFL